MKHRFLILTATLVVLLTCTFSHAEKHPIRVTFLSPSTDQNHAFWAQYIAFMHAAADNLSIDLTTVWGKNRMDVVDKANAALTKPETVDYLVYMYQAQSTRDILAKAEKAGVKSLVTNTDIMPEELEQVGKPREIFPLWIGHVFPDDFQAGRLLGAKLINSAQKKNMFASDGKVHLVGIGGSRDSTASIYRKKGLFEALHHNHKASLSQYVLTNWDREAARKKTLLLAKRYNGVKVYWAASDELSLGIQDALSPQKMRAGRDYLTGGIDWSPNGIKAVRDGRMECTVGGHFMEGAWVLVLLYDYHNGNDFKQFGTTLKSEMRLLDRTNLTKYLPVLNRANWEKIDFKRFTRTHNKRLKKYDFSPEAVARQLGRN